MRKRFQDSFHLRWLLYAIAIPCCVYLPIIIRNSDNGDIYYWSGLLIAFLFALFLGLTFLFTGGRKTGLSFLAAAILSITFSIVFWVSSHQILTAKRWTFHSTYYKQQVQAQPAPAPGDFRHIEWHGRGFAGSDTEQYLVYDPQDAIRSSAKHAFTFIKKPCQVWKKQRLEPHWYLLTFYTNTGWNDCG